MADFSGSPNFFFIYCVGFPQRLEGTQVPREPKFFLNCAMFPVFIWGEQLVCIFFNSFEPSLSYTPFLPRCWSTMAPSLNNLPSPASWRAWSQFIGAELRQLIGPMNRDNRAAKRCQFSEGFPGFPRCPRVF